MSTARLYVGNLSYSTTKETLEKAFGMHGEVVSVSIITDRQTGRPKGFAFVEMSTPEEGDAAKAALNGTDLEGRAINVDNAREQEQRKPGYGGGGSGYGGGGGYNGYSGGSGGSGGSRY
jgi:cold-inducible RNA-binding protein